MNEYGDIDEVWRVVASSLGDQSPHMHTTMRSNIWLKMLPNWHLNAKQWPVIKEPSNIVEVSWFLHFRESKERFIRKIRVYKLWSDNLTSINNTPVRDNNTHFIHMPISQMKWIVLLFMMMLTFCERIIDSGWLSSEWEMEIDEGKKSWLTYNEYLLPCEICFVHKSFVFFSGANGFWVGFKVVFKSFFKGIFLNINHIDNKLSKYLFL